MKRFYWVLVTIFIFSCSMQDADNSDCDSCVDGYLDGSTSTDASVPESSGDTLSLKLPDEDGDGYTKLDDCDDNDPSVFPGADEICDLKDNDCDGEIDNNLTDVGEPCGLSLGECEEGQSTCINGKLECDGDSLVLPKNEICDGKDNDCDGETDEDWPELGQVCEVGSGECTQTGYWECNGSATKLACSATPLLPQQEGPPGGISCYDGKDNDCDGLYDTDDPSCVSCLSDLECNDGNKCTKDECFLGTCLNSALPDGSPCLDSLYCNGIELCQAGVCGSGPKILCDDGNACTDDSCDESQDQCLFVLTPSLDSEGFPGSGTCFDGKDNDCDGLTDLSDSDCVECAKDTDCQDKGPCVNRVCNTKKVCEYSDKLDGSSCSDGVFCNGTEVCQSGVCTSGQPVSCDDGSACTLDTCKELPFAGCSYEPISGCKPCQTNSDCNDNNSCTSDLCSGGSCVNDKLPNGVSCDDGQWCTAVDQCQNGSCLGTMRDCSSYADSCNMALCDEATDSCKQYPKANGTSCDDNLYCNGHESCQNGVCQPGTPVACQTSDQCKVGSCNESLKQCDFIFNTNPGSESWQISGTCSDGKDNDCDGLADYADSDCRQCQLNSDCNDNNSCTQDVCNTSTWTCTHSNLNGTSCDDGQWCTIGEYCVNGYCTNGVQRNCVSGYCDESQDACTNSGSSGCADGQREGFVDQGVFPVIAGCSGAWRIEGLNNTRSSYGCSSAGDDSSDSNVRNGYNCRAADICAVGWHICDNEYDVSQDLPYGKTCADGVPNGDKLFFATLQPSQGDGKCTSSGSNDIFGCGNFGDPPALGYCGVLNRFGSEDCLAIANIPGTSTLVWDCDASGDTQNERDIVKKLQPELGGVLCCKD